MKFSTFVLVEQVEGQSAEKVFADLIDHAVYAEELGFDAIWIAEHHFTNYGIVPSPAVLGAAIAARTKRIRIGIAVAVLPFHDPIRLAEDYAMLDVLSGGRLEFGVGRGYQPHEFKAFGIPMSEARSRFDEAVEVIDGLWRNERFSYAGQHFQFDNLQLYPRPLQQPPQMWMAAVSPDTFTRVGHAGRPFLSSPSITPIDKIREGFDTYRRALREAGHPDQAVLPLQRHVFIGDSAEEAYQAAHDPYMWYLTKNSGLMANPDVADPSYQLYQRAAVNKAKSSYDSIFNSRATLIGTAEQAIDRIQELHDELDLNYMLCSFLYGGIDPKLANLSMKRFAEQVAPHFQQNSTSKTKLALVG